jgi:rRNA maturation RNase YbeY
VVLLDDAGMAPANTSFFGTSYATDVISAHYEPMPGETGWTGEILVNAERALVEGSRRGSVAHELALYIAHGCQHLGGAADSTPMLRARMRRTELRWLREAHARGYLSELIKKDALPV